MMQTTDILLVSAPGISPLTDMVNRGVGVLPVGLASIGAVLIENGYQVKAVDLFNKKITATSFRELIEETTPQIVGFSAATETYSNAIRLARICKQVNVHIKVIIGGPHVTFMAKEVLQELAFDVVVRGEGEFSMLELAGFYLHGYGSLERIRGISYRQNGQIENNQARQFIQRLDDLPFLQRDLFTEKYSVPGNILTSRGCPSHCIFCAAAAMSGGKYRMRSAENVVDEIVYLQRQGIGGKIKFLDDTVTAGMARLVRILDLIEQLNIRTIWAAESRVDVVTENALARMAQLGCVSIQFGVESGSQEILDKICKGIKLDQVIRAVEWATKAGIHVCCSFILGHPFDTEQTIRETLNLGLHLQSEYSTQVLFSISTPYPGTYLYNHADELGLLNLNRNFDDYNFLNPVFDTKFLNRQQIRNLQFEMVQQLFATMPKAVQNYYRSQQEAWGL